MSYIIGDIFIGDFPLTQGFGQNPAAYKQFGINGHDGMDFGCPRNTQVVAANDGIVKAVAYDAEGYGNYVELYHPNGSYMTIYAHFTKAIVTIGQQVIRGQLLGYSGNTGNVFPIPTTAEPDNGCHLHFGVAPCDGVGNKTEAGNGFAGWIDPNGARCTWQLQKLTQPAINATVYQKGGWYDNPATKQNQRWWVYPDGVAEFLPVGYSDPTVQMVAEHAGYVSGGWYDNPATGVNQRWWCVDGKCDFLPVGQTEPASASVQTVPNTITSSPTVATGSITATGGSGGSTSVPPVQPPSPQPAPVVPTAPASDPQTVKNLNTLIEGLKDKLSGVSIKAERVVAAESESQRLQKLYDEEHALRVQAEAVRTQLLEAQGSQNRQISYYKRFSIEAADAWTLIKSAITKMFTNQKGGGKKNGQSTASTIASTSNSDTKTTP